MPRRIQQRSWARAIVLVCGCCFGLQSGGAMSSSTGNVKRILVTGGNKGIGKAICERLLTEWKDTHVLMGSRNPQNGQDAVNDLIRTIGGDCQDRLEYILLDTASDSSVRHAADQFQAGSDNPQLYGIINNAGIGLGYSMAEVINTNYFGPRRVNEAFGKFLQRPGGRIVNIASASGPNYVSSLPDSSPFKSLLAQPWTVAGGIAALDDLARRSSSGGEDCLTGPTYGASKALLNAYTVILAKLEPALTINSVTPGYIQTDMTIGTSASNPPSQGAIPPCWLLMDTETVPSLPPGRYYGSDRVRSPLSFYRGPGEAPYEDTADLVDVPESARTIPALL